MSISRRRILFIAAASFAYAATPAGARAPDFHWRGHALGTEADLVLDGVSEAAGQRAAAAVMKEVARLERIFSLYRADSALVALNRNGDLPAPPAELVDVLTLARAVHVASDGLFDPTVQPLWEASVRALARPQDRDVLLAAARDLVGFDGVTVSRDRIRFSKVGMALTLNGIAQGYMTDRVGAVLRDHGFDNVLINLGEIRALGGRRDGRPWRVGYGGAAPDAAVDGTMLMDDDAVATSSGFGTPLSRGGVRNHIFDPRTGEGATRYRFVTVRAPAASQADALATALTLMPDHRFPEVLAALGGREVRAVRTDGTEIMHRV